jgi:hypothetical protein
MCGAIMVIYSTRDSQNSWQDPWWGHWKLLWTDTGRLGLNRGSWYLFQCMDQLTHLALVSDLCISLTSPVTYWQTHFMVASRPSHHGQGVWGIWTGFYFLWSPKRSRLVSASGPRSRLASSNKVMVSKVSLPVTRLRLTLCLAGSEILFSSRADQNKCFDSS